MHKDVHIFGDVVAAVVSVALASSAYAAGPAKATDFNGTTTGTS